MDYTFAIAPNPDRFNELANSPAIRPFVTEKDQGWIDLNASWPRCVGLLWQEGGFLFQQLDDAGLWEVHTLFEDSSRARFQVQEAAHFLFTHLGVSVLTTRTPESCAHARRFAQKAGMRDAFTVKQVWRGHKGPEDLHILQWRPEEWIAGCADLEISGRAVHEALESSGFHTNHGEDPVHERFVGFVAECYRAGLPHRGVYYYNRWAVSCGYEPVLFISSTQCAFSGTLVTMTPDGYEVTSCLPVQ